MPPCPPPASPSSPSGCSRSIGVVLIDVVVPDAHALSWLALALPLAIVAGIIAQLAVAEQRGFVVRLAATASGSFVLVLLGAVVALAA